MTNLRLDCDPSGDARHTDVDERQDVVALVTRCPNPGNILLNKLVVDRDFLHDELNACVVPQPLLTNSNSNII